MNETVKDQEGASSEYIFETARKLRVPEKGLQVIEPRLAGGKSGLLIPNIPGMRRDTIIDIHKSFDPNGEIVRHFGWIEVGAGGDEVISADEAFVLAPLAHRIADVFRYGKVAELASIERLQWRPVADRDTSQVFHQDAYERQPRFGYFFLPSYEADPGEDYNGALGMGEQHEISRRSEDFVSRFLAAIDPDAPDDEMVWGVLQSIGKVEGSNFPASVGSVAGRAFELVQNPAIKKAVMVSIAGSEAGQRLLHELYGRWERDHVCVISPHRVGGLKIVDNTVTGMAHAGIAKRLLEGKKSAKFLLQATV